MRGIQGLKDNALKQVLTESQFQAYVEAAPLIRQAVADAVKAKP